jgi:hypothetical protein
MDGFAAHGSKHLCFTPPTTRGSNITRCEAWALNVQRDYVPTLCGMGRWPAVKIGGHPKILTRDQSDWLSKRWGECASGWVEAGCPGARIEQIAARKKEPERKKYADLVMQHFNEFEHQDKRELLDRRAAVEHAARQRL